MSHVAIAAALALEDVSAAGGVLAGEFREPRAAGVARHTGRGGARRVEP